jgi:hypothetical protein
MATKRVTPKRRPSLAQLADSIVTEAFKESFETYMKALIKHHPKSHGWLQRFLGTGGQRSNGVHAHATKGE